jgi:hypothetical protein
VGVVGGGGGVKVQGCRGVGGQMGCERVGSVWVCGGGRGGRLHPSATHHHPLPHPLPPLRRE